MSEELIQRGLVDSPPPFGDWLEYQIGSTTLAQLKKRGIIPDKPYTGLGRKKPDCLIACKGVVYAAVEYKPGRKLRTRSDVTRAYRQEIDVAKAVDAAVFVVTDGDEKAWWYNPRTGNPILTAGGDPLTRPFKKDVAETCRLIRQAKRSLSDSCDSLAAAEPTNPLPLAKVVWQDLWAVSGATPENCLYTFVEIFVFKYLSDLDLLTGLYSFGHLFGLYGDNTDEKVLDYYAATVRKEIKRLFPASPEDKTTIINGTIFVSKDDAAVSGYATVFRSTIGRFHDFGSLKNIDKDFKSRLFETFLKESVSKKNWGQYFTPLCVVKAIVDMADVRRGQRICDPACGVGKFLLEAVADKIDCFYEVDSRGAMKGGVTIAGFDKGFDREEQKTIILAKANMLIYFSELISRRPESTASFSRLLNESFRLQTNSILGTLARPSSEEYDLILTNPPYVMSGSAGLKDEIQKRAELEDHYTALGQGIEGLFLEWIVKALKPGGQAFVVVPDGLLRRAGDANLRKFITDTCALRAIVSLPVNTFYTTRKKTYILAIARAESSAAPKPPVFCYLCREIGETRDVNRFPLERNDLASAASLYKQYKGDPFGFVSRDPCCKLIEARSFEAEESTTITANGESREVYASDWTIERHWDEEALRTLGIHGERDSLDFGAFAEELETLSATVVSLRTELDRCAQRTGVSHYKEIGLTGGHFEFITTSLGMNKQRLHELESEQGCPVFTAAAEAVAVIDCDRVDKLIECSEESPVLSLATNGDGCAGTNIIVHSTPFYIGNDRLAIRSISSDIDIAYVAYAMRNIKRQHRFNHAYKATKGNLIKNVKIMIPVDEGGRFDLGAQTRIVEKAQAVLQVKSELGKLSEYILSADVDLAAE